MRDQICYKQSCSVSIKFMHPLRMIFSMCQPLVDKRCIASKTLIEGQGLEQDGYIQAKDLESRLLSKKPTVICYSSVKLPLQVTNVIKHENKIANGSFQSVSNLQTATIKENSPTATDLEYLTQQYAMSDRHCSDSVYFQSPGGSALNTFRFLSQHRADLAFMGCIGTDANGIYLTEALKSNQIDYRIMTTPGSTGHCSVLVNDNKRSMITDLGVANDLSIDFMQKHQDALKSASILYLCTFVIVDMPQQTKYLLECFIGEIVLNLSNKILFQKLDRALMTKILERTTTIIGNHDEFLAFYEFLGFEYQGDLAMLKTLSRKQTVICTHGDIATLVGVKGMVHTVDTVKVELEHLDTCGAGDIFAAAILTEGDILDRVKKGNFYAAQYIKENSLKMFGLKE